MEKKSKPYKNNQFANQELRVQCLHGHRSFSWSICRIAYAVEQSEWNSLKKRSNVCITTTAHCARPFPTNPRLPWNPDSSKYFFSADLKSLSFCFCPVRWAKNWINENSQLIPQASQQSCLLNEFTDHTHTRLSWKKSRFAVFWYILSIANIKWKSQNNTMARYDWWGFTNHVFFVRVLTLHSLNEYKAEFEIKMNTEIQLENHWILITVMDYTEFDWNNQTKPGHQNKIYIIKIEICAAKKNSNNNNNNREKIELLSFPRIHSRESINKIKSVHMNLIKLPLSPRYRSLSLSLGVFPG